jgi:hypothetical protein
MTFILKVNSTFIGPFYSHKSAQFWAEHKGLDNYTMLKLISPFEINK